MNISVNDPMTPNNAIAMIFFLPYRSPSFPNGIVTSSTKNS